MTVSPGPQGYGPVAASLTVALVLTLLPMPHWAGEFRPQWVALTLIFWALTVPDRVGVFWAFGAGLLLDVVSGSVLGQNALALSVVVYLALELHQRIRIYPMWQQAISVWVLLLVERLLTVWVLGATGAPTPTLWYWVSTFLGMLLWPWLSALLRDFSGRHLGH
jgi:rod shape-determining protein MreD